VRSKRYLSARSQMGSDALPPNASAAPLPTASLVTAPRLRPKNCPARPGNGSGTARLRRFARQRCSSTSCARRSPGAGELIEFGARQTCLSQFCHLDGTYTTLSQRYQPNGRATVFPVLALSFHSLFPCCSKIRRERMMAAVELRHEARASRWGPLRAERARTGIAPVRARTSIGNICRAIARMGVRTKRTGTKLRGACGGAALLPRQEGERSLAVGR
jgi:hypothetical protein